MGSCNPVPFIFESEKAGGLLLIIATIISVAVTNSVLGPQYLEFWQTKFAGLTLEHWVNDGLMAIFFLLIGLEVKRELVEGGLSTREKAMFPAIAAVGGMVVPAAVFLFFNMSDDVAKSGWAFPAATDIAFALGVLALFGKRIPVSLKVFLLALAIIDDLGVIVIIALFYSPDLYMTSLLVAALSCAVLFVMNVRGERRLSLYMLMGLVLWVAVLRINRPIKKCQ